MIPQPRRKHPRTPAPNRNHSHQTLNPASELYKVVAAEAENQAWIAQETRRRMALMERVLYWSRKPHGYMANLDPQGTMCDLCFAPVDAVQHLLHPIPVVKPS